MSCEFESLSYTDALKMADEAQQCIWHRSCNTPRQKGSTHCAHRIAVLESVE